jgi:predicted RNase H-like nuclease
MKACIYGDFSTGAIIMPQASAKHPMSAGKRKPS